MSPVARREAAPAAAGEAPAGPARESLVRVRYAETDRMGIAYHASYLVWFEVGRTNWIRAAGLRPADADLPVPAGAGTEVRARSYADLEAAGYFLPVVEAVSRYHCPAHYDEELLVRTTLASASRARLTFDYEVLRRRDGVLLALGRTVHAVTDRAGRATRLPREWLDWLLEEPVPYEGAADTIPRP